MMLRLEKSKALGRKIRKDDWKNLGESTWSLLEKAIRQKDDKLALEIIDYLYTEGKTFHDAANDTWAAYITYIGANFGEPEVEKYWRSTVENTVLGNSEISEDTLERMYVIAEVCRGAHYVSDGQVRFKEEADRFVLEQDCPSGGRIKTTRLKPPYNFGVSTKPFTWSWSRTGIPWYCAHCSVCRGIMSIETSGFPVRVHDLPQPGEPESRCRHIYYKKPESIPEKYFTELGMKKDPSRFGRKAGGKHG
ncbi:MAG: hypothetical protein Q7R57_03745 [Dehalococcoidales bacterium]|nr:hypothetical protein [Dehalococcoidales bacterium]